MVSVFTPPGEQVDSYEEPRQQPRQRRPPLKSIIPCAAPYKPFRQPLFNPKTSKKLYDRDDEYD